MPDVFERLTRPSVVCSRHASCLRAAKARRLFLFRIRVHIAPTSNHSFPSGHPPFPQRAGDGLAQYETKVKVENQYGVVRDAIPRWQSGM
jgi:hypothetical protein